VCVCVCQCTRVWQLKEGDNVGYGHVLEPIAYKFAAVLRHLDPRLSASHALSHLMQREERMQHMSPARGEEGGRERSVEN
jgi:hypothetical protein